MIRTFEWRSQATTFRRHLNSTFGERSRIVESLESNKVYSVAWRKLQFRVTKKKKKQFFLEILIRESSISNLMIRTYDRNEIPCEDHRLRQATNSFFGGQIKTNSHLLHTVALGKLSMTSLSLCPHWHLSSSVKCQNAYLFCTLYLTRRNRSKIKNTNTYGNIFRHDVFLRSRQSFVLHTSRNAGMRARTSPRGARLLSVIWVSQKRQWADFAYDAKPSHVKP